MNVKFIFAIYFCVLFSFLKGSVLPKDSIGNKQGYVLYTENKGQWEESILYQAKIKGGKAFFKNNEIRFLLYPEKGLKALHHRHQDSSMNLHALSMQFLNANHAPKVIAIDSNSYYENYFIGDNSKNWASQVKSYQQIMYQQIYPNIDAVFLSDKNNFRHDFILHAGADINAIQVEWQGANALTIKDGGLYIQTSVGELYQSKPLAYQMIDGEKKRVTCEYVLNKKQLSFKITSNYNPFIDLIIDPTLVFATYTGSTADNFGMTATYDVAGNAFTAGICFGMGYPITLGAFQASMSGGMFDISISKFNPTGTALLYSTYLGGNNEDDPESIVVDNADNLVIFGRTKSTNYPKTVGAFQTALAGNYDCIITKFNATGTALIGSTYLGGSANDGINGLAYNYEDGLRGSVIVDVNNNIYVASNTWSGNFPVTSGCYQSTNNGSQDGIVAKFNPQLTMPYFITYIGGTGLDAVYNITLNQNDELYVCGGTASTNFPTTSLALHPITLGGRDGFATLFSASGNALVASTYIGTNSYNQAFFIQTDKQNKVYVYGQTEGGYPVTSGVYNNANSGQFIHCLNANLSSTYFSTVVGTGSGYPDIVPSAFLVDVCGSIYIAGWGGTLMGYNNAHSTTNGLPITPNAFMTNTDGNDFYFLVLDKDALALQYATFFGGAQSEEHVDGGTSRFDKKGIIYQAICESCGGNNDMPSTSGVYSNINGSSNCNNAVVKFSFNPNIVVSQLAITSNGTKGCTPFVVSFGNNSVNATDYSWNFGDGSPTTTVATPSHTYTSVGTFTIQLIAHNANTCNIFDTVHTIIEVFPALQNPPLSNTLICYGDSVTLNLPATIGATYTWTPSNLSSNSHINNPKVSPQVTTNFVVTIANNACSVSNSVTIMVSKNETKITTVANHACLEDTVKLLASPISSSYVWSTGSTNQGITVLTAGWFFLTATNADGCPVKDSLEILGLTKIPLSSYQFTMCSNQSLIFPAPSGYQYNWTPNYAINDAHIFNPIVHPQANTIYTLTLNNGSCQSYASYSVIVYPLPPINVSPKYSEIYAGESVELQSLTDTITQWQPSIYLDCTFCNHTKVSPSDNITYTAIVKNKYGCESRDTLVVKIIPTLYIPNCFTPNYDLLNDIFRPVYTGYKKIELRIFDRWGEEIFKTTDLMGGWDGTKNNNECQQGVYIYKLMATDYNNEILNKVGHVTLVR